MDSLRNSRVRILSIVIALGWAAVVIGLVWLLNHTLTVFETTRNDANKLERQLKTLDGDIQLLRKQSPASRCIGYASFDRNGQHQEAGDIKSFVRGTETGEYVVTLKRPVTGLYFPLAISDGGHVLLKNVPQPTSFAIKLYDVDNHPTSAPASIYVAVLSNN